MMLNAYILKMISTLLDVDKFGPVHAKKNKLTFKVALIFPVLLLCWGLF